MIPRLLIAISWFISLIQVVLVVRAIGSWFQGIAFIEPFYKMACAATEPIVAPIRNAINKNASFASAPVDMSVLFAYLALELLRILLF